MMGCLRFSIQFLGMIIIGGLGSIMGSLMGTAFMVLLPESMQWLTDALAGGAIDRAVDLSSSLAFLREMAIGAVMGWPIAGSGSRHTGSSTRSPTDGPKQTTDNK